MRLALALTLAFCLLLASLTGGIPGACGCTNGQPGSACLEAGCDCSQPAKSSCCSSETEFEGPLFSGCACGHGEDPILSGTRLLLLRTAEVEYDLGGAEPEGRVLCLLGGPPESPDLLPDPPVPRGGVCFDPNPTSLRTRTRSGRHVCS